MYVLNGIAYAGEPDDELSVTKIKILDDMYMIVEFSTGEKRIFDASVLLKYPVYKKLIDPEMFATAAIEDGFLVWLNGDIDIGTQTLYRYSLPYTAKKLA